MESNNLIGFAITGSFCTISKSLDIMSDLILSGHQILPIMSETAYSNDTRFGQSREIQERVKKITGREIVHSIIEAEPLGPKIKLDAMIICPCTGNTMAKIANGITDTAVTMAAKAHLRNNNPLLIALATNDALSANLKNIGTLLSRKNIYFVPMSQDDPLSKPHSMVADFDMVKDSLEMAIQGKQIPKLFK
jgi:dipicolinate synthase subunit B